MPGDSTWPVDTSSTEMFDRVHRRAHRLRRRDRLVAAAVPFSLLLMLYAGTTVLTDDHDSSELRTVRPAGSSTTSTTATVEPGRPDGSAVAVEPGRPRGTTQSGRAVDAPGVPGAPGAMPSSASSPSATVGAAKVAFIRQGRIWMVNADGSGLRAVTGEGQAFSGLHWSPDGRRIAATSASQGATRVAVVGLDGSVRFLTAEDDEARDPRWSPDGTRLLYAMPDEATGPASVTALWVVNADGSGRRLVTSGGFDPDWSPDATRVVYRCGNGTCSVGLDGSNQHLVSATHFGARWSPDGSRLAAIRMDGSTGTSSGALVTMTPDGRDERVVTETLTNRAEWSPDGEWLVVQRSASSTCTFANPCTPKWNIWLTRPDGSGMRQLTSESGDSSPSMR